MAHAQPEFGLTLPILLLCCSEFLKRALEIWRPWSRNGDVRGPSRVLGGLCRQTLLYKIREELPVIRPELLGARVRVTIPRQREETNRGVRQRKSAYRGYPGDQHGNPG